MSRLCRNLLDMDICTYIQMPPPPRLAPFLANGKKNKNKNRNTRKSVRWSAVPVPCLSRSCFRMWEGAGQQEFSPSSPPSNWNLEFGPLGWIWILRLGSRLWGWDLGQKAGIWAKRLGIWVKRLGFGPKADTLALRPMFKPVG